MVSASLVVLALAGSALADWTAGAGGWSSPVLSWGPKTWSYTTPCETTSTYSSESSTWSAVYTTSSVVTAVSITSWQVWTPVSSTVVAGTTSVVSSPAWSYIPSSVAPSPATTWAVWSSTPVYTPAPVVSTPAPVVSTPETTYAPVPVTTSVAPAPVTTYAPTTVAPVVSYTPTTPAPSVSSFLGAASHQKPAAALLAGVAGLVALL